MTLSKRLIPLSIVIVHLLLVICNYYAAYTIFQTGAYLGAFVVFFVLSTIIKWVCFSILNFSVFLIREGEAITA